jgi:hypothetical protein
MKTIGEFLKLVINTDILEGKLLIEEWRDSCSDEEWEQGERQILTNQTVLLLRTQISSLFAHRMADVCTDALYKSVLTEHQDFIAEYDAKAAQQGFVITEERPSITATEVMVKAGLVEVKDGTVCLR